jgi:hypothetical protein
MSNKTTFYIGPDIQIYPVFATIYRRSIFDVGHDIEDNIGIYGYSV